MTGASKKPPTLHHTTRNGEMKTGHPTPRTKEKDRRIPAKQRRRQKQNNRAGDTRERERGPPQASRNTPDAAAAVRNVLRGLSPLGASLLDKLVERPSEARTKKKGPTCGTLTVGTARSKAGISRCVFWGRKVWVWVWVWLGGRERNWGKK